MNISKTFFGICALSLTALSTISAQTLLFDFGRESPISGNGGLTTSTGWNNIYVPGQPASAYYGNGYVARSNTESTTLVTSTGATSAITVGNFNGGNWGVSGGGANATTSVTSPSGIEYPTLASIDSFFASDSPPTPFNGEAAFLSFTISNLTVSNTYTFHFYASSGGSGGRSDFQVSGLTVGTGFINSTGNTDTFVTISNIAPNVDGTIDILLGGKATTEINSRYNTMEIATIPEPGTSILILFGLCGVYLTRPRRCRG